MPRLTLREAITAALREEMQRDPNVFIMGEEVGELLKIRRGSILLRARLAAAKQPVIDAGIELSQLLCHIFRQTCLQQPIDIFFSGKMDIR